MNYYPTYHILKILELSSRNLSSGIDSNTLFSINFQFAFIQTTFQTKKNTLRFILLLDEADLGFRNGRKPLPSANFLSALT
jgi:hypothetical protein